jgi:hypothetical protein
MELNRRLSQAVAYGSDYETTVDYHRLTGTAYRMVINSILD